ncbi:MAG TPA: hypothetical protein VE732_05495 [Nitrososphaera sp.]|nr:hypothetical protein [Nitrososphaera sp.]
MGWGLFERRTEKFEGEVSETGFKISRIIRYRNSFLPIVQGQFTPSVKGMRIEVRMRLHMAVLIFSILWLSFFGAVAVAFISQIISTGKFEGGMFIPFGMLLFYYLLVTISFGVEANKASKLLWDIFEADDYGTRKPNNSLNRSAS